MLGRDEAPLAAVKNSGATGRVWCRGLPPFPRRQFGVLAQLLMAKLAAARQFSLDLVYLYYQGGESPQWDGLQLAPLMGRPKQNEIALSKEKWRMGKTCGERGSNTRPSDLQSDALPTELSPLIWQLHKRYLTNGLLSLRGLGQTAK